MFKKVCILSGNSHPALAQAIAAFLETPLGKSKMTRFSDGETFVEQELAPGLFTISVDPQPLELPLMRA